MPSDADLNGTHLAGSHIGDKASDNLAAALFAGTEPVKLSQVSLAAEVGNARLLTLQVQDRAGRALAERVDFHLRSYGAAMIEELVAATSLTAVTGDAETTDAQAAAIFKSDTAGLIAVTVTDVSTALVGDIEILAEPVDREGPTQRFTVAFA